jgi:hypothetical protein
VFRNFFHGTIHDIMAYPGGLRAAWGLRMKNYSIVRIGNEYVVQADDKSILKVASRRRAARLVTDAAELLQSQPVAKLPPDAHTEPSIASDPPEVP